MQNHKKTLTLNNRLLDNIEMAMDDNSYETEWYLDLQKEEATFFSEYYNEDEELQELIENDDEGERFIAIPGRPSHEGWELMEEFILSLEDQDEDIRNLLLINIQGSGAFGRFKDAIYSIGLQERWFAFKGQNVRREVLDWLRALGLITDEDIEKGMQLYEERVTKRKQREKEIDRMSKGMQVRCRINDGHEDKLTIGKAYDVWDEQKEHLNIRIRDDRGKLVYLPKNYFELLS